MADKKTVMLTGGSGNMGFAGFKELYAKKDEFNITLLLRGSEKNREKFKAYLNDPSVRIVWGDLTKYEDVLDAVNGADYVLHVGGMVSPTADWKPYRTQKTNIGAAENICNAVKAQPNPDAVKVCYIGTVAETGDRNYPIHWGRCGDPLKVSIYDHYAVSKCRAEAVFVESGLKNWVVMRQSGILYPNILKNMDPIMFHVPINGVLEWCTVEDSGRLLANLCDEDAKGNLGSDFWNHFYNIRNTEFLTMSLSAFFLAHSVLQAPRSSLILTGSSQRTSTVSSMQTATSSKTTFTSVKIFLLRTISTVLQIRLNSTSRFRDIFRRVSQLLVLSPL